MKWTYVIGPDWTDRDGLAVHIKWTARMSREGRDAEFRAYVERALEAGHSGLTITVEEER